MDFLSQPISSLKGVGAYYLKKLDKLGIKTIKDLLWHFPVRYETTPQVTKINEIINPGVYTIIARVKSIQTRRAWRRRMFIVEGVLSDDTANINVVWFGQPYLVRSIPKDSTGIFSGKVVKTKTGICLQSPTYEIISRQAINLTEIDLGQYDLKHTGSLVPVYPETKGLTSRGLRFLIKPLLFRVREIIEWLPQSVLRQLGLPEISAAIKQIHFPESLVETQKAKARFAFAELFLLQIFLALTRQNNQKLSAPEIAINIDRVKEFLKTLPFVLTQGQKQALWEILQDLAKPYPMNRLLNGDVGSGKTIIAFISALQAIKQGYQAVLLAPTEVLARQHFNRAKELLGKTGISLALCVAGEIQVLTDGMAGPIKRLAFISMLEKGLPILVIGTHAVIQKGIEFKNLGLVIVDEQHRFGIKQRQELLKRQVTSDKRQDGGQIVPHLLSMTATPIPRTLALTLWGDLDISVLRELPQGRQPIVSKVISESRRGSLYTFIRKQVSLGHRVFIICPRIEEPEKELTYTQYLNLDTKAVKKEHERLQKEIFSDLSLGILHGKMKSQDKEQAMTSFVLGKTPVLVCTSVIEVGVDVPEATVMVIEGADHFGLAQLHQFRGRVGRSSRQSYCFLLSSSASKGALERLHSFANTQDGFSLAEQDLKTRGPGEFIGIKQSGLPDLAMASLQDTSLVMAAKTSAQKILEQDQLLQKYPLLKKQLAEFSGKIHLE
jgi:ATP-dependent DNA helicase RecG